MMTTTPRPKSDSEILMEGKSTGLGDTIAKITTKIGIKPCGACKRRQKFLNKKFPYRKNIDEVKTSDG